MSKAVSAAARPAFTGPSERVCIGISLALLFGLAFPLINPEQPSWIMWLLLWSPGVLMLMGDHLGDRHGYPRMPFLNVLMLFMLWTSVIYPPGDHAGFMSLPWLVSRMAVAILVMFSGLKQPVFSGWALCLDAARAFPAIGAAWLVANRYGYEPFGFDALIVLLTAAHFHHAGFSLPLMAGLCGRELPGRLSRLSCSLILGGVPLVALGITCTHFKMLPWVEPISVAVLVAGAVGVAVMHLRLAFQPQQRTATRVLFLISGSSLFIAMLLALSYGLRSLLPQFALTMPGMWAAHGALNTFGFGLCGILAWRAMERQKNAAA